MEVLDQSTDVNEVIETAVTSLGPRGNDVEVDLPSLLPRVRTDPVLLERAVANLIDNSLTHAGGKGLRVEAGSVAGRVHIRIIDRGPGIPRPDRDRVFLPFQRLGDSANHGGVGLGLAVARGFVEAVGGALDIEDTPGGGCTMVVRIPEEGSKESPGSTTAGSTEPDSAAVPAAEIAGSATGGDQPT
jgi:two-component system sensor histidine kinase KdpD